MLQSNETWKSGSEWQSVFELVFILYHWRYSDDVYAHYKIDLPVLRLCELRKISFYTQVIINYMWGPNVCLWNVKGRRRSSCIILSTWNYCENIEWSIEDRTIFKTGRGVYDLDKELFPFLYRSSFSPLMPGKPIDVCFLDLFTLMKSYHWYSVTLQNMNDCKKKKNTHHNLAGAQAPWSLMRGLVQCQFSVWSELGKKQACGTSCICKC